MPRDRLAELKAQAAEHRDDNDEGTDIEADIEASEGEEFMEGFFKRIKSIRDSIAKVEDLIEKYEHKNADLLVAVSKAQQKEINESITTISDEISTVSNRIRRDLKTMDDENKREEQMSKMTSLSADMRIRKSQQATLARKFVQVMSHFSELQAANKQKQRDQLKRQCKIVDPNITDEAIDNIAENGAENIFSGKRLAEAEAALSDIQDRHNEILKLEKSLTELHEMFLDLSIMIESQGEMIDRVEFSVDKAANYVQVARQNLSAAKKSQSGARKKQILIVICCLCIAGVIVAAVIGPIASRR